MKITSENFPWLLKAINFLRLDNDLRSTKSYTVKNSYKLYDAYSNNFTIVSFTEEDLLSANYALSTLSEDDFEEFICGDVSFIEINSQYNYGLKVANSFLEVIFENI